MFDAKKMVDPIMAELGSEEAKMLGEFFETKTWVVFCKYMNLNRAEQINVNLIHAKDMREAGEVQGYIGAYNKMEFDMHHYHATYQELKKADTIQTQVQQIDEAIQDEYDQDIPNPFDL